MLMTEITSRSWIAIDGTLETIDFAGAADDRFPAELAEIVLGAFSRPGDWVLDPFAGLGTTVHAAQQLGRRAIGFERDPARAEWARRGLVAPNTIIQASIETIGERSTALQPGIHQPALRHRGT